MPKLYRINYQRKTLRTVIYPLFLCHLSKHSFSKIAICIASPFKNLENLICNLKIIQI